jgi:hypothetical protein
VENQPALGPVPVRSGQGGLPLSGQRATVLERLQHREEPTTVSVLAVELGLHDNTVREHLEALVAAGLALRERAAAAGPPGGTSPPPAWSNPTRASATTRGWPGPWRGT